MRASNSLISRFKSKAASVRLLNMLSALRELTPFNSLTADEEVLLDELIVHWHRTDNLTISDVMVGTRRVSSSTNYRRLIALCRNLFDLGNELSKLRGWHIIVLSIANAVANGVILNTCLFVGGERQWDTVQMMSIFVGDVLGTAIVLAVLTSLIHVWLRLQRPRF